MSEAPPPPLIDPYSEQQPPPTANAAQQQAYSARTVHGSAGPVIAVLAVITLLIAAAVMIGRLCSGRGIFGRGPRYDFESWVETKCASCLDGHVDSPPRRRVVVEHVHSNRSTVEPAAATVGVPAEAATQESNGEEEEEDETNSDEQEPPQQRRNHDPPVHPPPPDHSKGP